MRGCMVQIVFASIYGGFGALGTEVHSIGQCPGVRVKLHAVQADISDAGYHALGCNVAIGPPEMK